MSVEFHFENITLHMQNMIQVFAEAHTWGVNAAYEVL